MGTREFIDSFMQEVGAIKIEKENGYVWQYIHPEDEMMIEVEYDEIDNTFTIERFISNGDDTYNSTTLHVFQVE